MRTATPAQAIARTCGIIVLAVTVAYVLLVVLPFYANGIHLRSYQEIAGSHVDVKGYPPFVWLGAPAQGSAMLAAALALPGGLLLAPLTLLLMGVKWNSFRRDERALWITTCVASILALALTWHTRGVMLTWLVD